MTTGLATSYRWRWLLPVVLAVAVFHLAPVRDALDRAFFDTASRHPLRSSPPPDGSAIVLMDNATMDALSNSGFGGAWPPPRGVFAALIAGLHRAGAAKIIVDFAFLDHSTAMEQDQFLAALAAGIPSVTLAGLKNRPPAKPQMPAFWDERFIAAHPSFFKRARVGFVDADVDPDGVIRGYHVADSLAANALDRSVEPNGTLLRWHGGIEHLRRQQQPRVPILSAASYVIAGLPTVGRLSESNSDANYEPAKLASLLASEPPLEGDQFKAVKGRIVFVGTNLAAGFDQKPFAVGGIEPGVLVHWTAWANLVDHDFIRRLPAFVSLLAAVFIIALLVVAGAGRAAIVVPILVAIGLAGATLATAYVGLAQGWFFAPATPVVASGLGLIGVVTEKFWVERRRRQEVQTMFGSYVDPEVVNRLVRDPNAIRLGGEKRDATVFFCDLVGFTDLSEAVKPGDLFELVNGYLHETSDCLMEHGAYIDKYIGDAVMAVFGAPLEQPEHALAACRAALGAQRVLAERNATLAVTHQRTLHMRIGINTGEMLVGNLGSERKKNYTVLGDAVNLASRLEGANKEFGTSILLGEETARRVRDTLVVRPLTALRVKGKQTAVQVFELVGEPADLTTAQQEFLAAYNEGHRLYTARRFAHAAAAFARALPHAPEDEMTRTLLAESQEFAATPPADDWQPILSLKTK